LLGILVSPSRGQLVFVPATLFVAYLVARYWRSLPLPRWRSLPLPRLIMPALLSVLGHVALISLFEQPRATWEWNKIPSDASLHPERVWDWRNPQPLAWLLPPR
jgi:hypothetical protein